MKRRRKYLGISQMDLAARANLSSGYIGELESGTKFPSGETLETLAEALEVRPFVLLMSSEDLSLEVRDQAVIEATDRLRSIVDKGFGELMETIRPRSGDKGTYD